MSTMRTFGSAAVAALLCTSVSASANDDLVRGLIGVGSAIILNQAQQQPRQFEQQRNAPPRRSYNTYRNAPRARSQRNDDDQTRLQRAEIQRRLNALGYNAGEPDGVYGPRTRRAIAGFQASLGRNADGVLSRADVAALYAATGASSGGTAFDAGSTRSFPQLGGAPAAAGATEQGGFPALGAASAGDGPAAAGFPKLGSAVEGSASEASRGFPTLGAPAEPTSAGGAFPSLGKSPAEQADDASMPKLAAPPGSGGTEFPTLTNAAPEPTEAALPAIVPAPEQEDIAFPKTARPPEPGKAMMPALDAQPETNEAMPKLGGDGAVRPSGPAREATTLDEEIARTVYGQREAQPSIAGTLLGQKNKEALKALRENGFPSCEEQARSVKCSRATDTLKDTVFLWTTGEEVWAIRRTIEFASPAPADFVMRQFHATYPELLADAQRVVTSGRQCHVAELPDMGIAVLLGRMDKVLGAEDEKLPDDIVDYARTCPLLYMVGFEGAGTITAARLTFIDGTPFIRRGMAERREKEVREKDNHEKLSNDLKL